MFCITIQECDIFSHTGGSLIGIKDGIGIAVHGSYAFSVPGFCMYKVKYR